MSGEDGNASDLESLPSRTASPTATEAAQLLPVPPVVELLQVGRARVDATLEGPSLGTRARAPEDLVGILMQCLRG